MALVGAIRPAQGQAISPPVEMGGDAGQESGFGSDPRIVRVGPLLVATWSNQDGGSVLWATSTDAGHTWIPRERLSPDPTVTGLGCRGAATLVASATGHVYIAYRTIRNDGVEWVEVRRGTANTSTVTWDPPVAAVTFDPLGQRGADSPWLACDPTNAYLYLVYVSQGDQCCPGTDGPADLPVYFVRSVDGGQTWSLPQLIGGPAALGTRVEVGESGQLYVIWQDYFTSQVVLRRSNDHGVTFSEVRPVGRFVSNGITRPRGSDGNTHRRHPLVSYNRGVWDFPHLAVDRTNGPSRGTLYVVWAEAAEGTTAPGSGRFVAETEPNDTPATGNPVSIGDDFGSFGDSEFYDPDGNYDWYTFEGTKGTVLQLWQVFEQFPARDPPAANGNGVVVQEDMFDDFPNLFQGFYRADGGGVPLLFTVPRTSRFSIRGALSGGPRGELHYGYLREFLPLPSSVARDHRDIVLTRSTDGGLTWSPKVRVNDDPPGVDQAVPAVTVDEMGRVHVAWLDRREPPAGEVVDTYWTFSQDGGVTFQPSRRLSPVSSDYGPRWDNHAVPGDYIALLADAGSVYVGWPQVTPNWLVATMVRITDVPTSIAVPRFVAEPRGESVRLSWRVQDGSGITGFRLHRSPRETDEYQLVASQGARGAGEYEHVDNDVIAGQGYRYRLEVVRGGSSSWEGPVEIELPLGIASLAFERVGPNPFATEAHLVLALPERSWLDVRVYDVMGHEVRRLHSGEAVAGRHALAWDGRDTHGNAAPPGVYHLRADGAGQSVRRRLVRVR